MINVTIYDFRQVQLEPVKNANQNVWFYFFTRIMSFNSFNLILTIVFGGICNIWMIQSECIHRKILFTDKKKSIKSLCIISWNVLDVFVWPFLVFTTSFTLGMNKINHWNDHWIILWNRIFQIRYRRQSLNETFRWGPREKLVLGKKNLDPIFVFKLCENFIRSAVLQ